MADTTSTVAKLNSLRNSRLNGSADLDLNNPRVVLCRSVIPLYFKADHDPSTDQRHNSQEPASEEKCGHTICSFQRKGFQAGFIDRMLVETHRSLALVSDHNRNCDRTGQSDDEEDNILFGFVIHFDSYLKELARMEHFQTNGILARSKICEALAALAGERYEHGFCLQPLWRFLFTLVRVMHDLSAANFYSIDFSCTGDVDTCTQDQERCDHMVLDSNELRTEDQACVICLDSYCTPEEVDNRGNLFYELPLDMCDSSEAGISLDRISGFGPLTDEELGPDVPYLTRCGHVLGLACLRRLTYEKFVMGNEPFALCPLCRTPLLRRDWKQQFLIFSMGYDVGFTIDDGPRES